jgi:hypothetical protein
MYEGGWTSEAAAQHRQSERHQLPFWIMDLEKKSKSNKEGSCDGEAWTIGEDWRRRMALGAGCSKVQQC